MAATDIDPSEITKWDPGLTEKVMGFLRPLIKGYHRAEVRGLDSFPNGGRWWCRTTQAACSHSTSRCSRRGSTRSSATPARCTR